MSPYHVENLPCLCGFNAKCFLENRILLFELLDFSTAQFEMFYILISLRTERGPSV